MQKKGARRDQLPELLEHHGGTAPGVASQVARVTGVPEADVYGTASFYTLLSNQDAGTRVCQGLSCKLAGADSVWPSFKPQGSATRPSAALASATGRLSRWTQPWS